MLVSILYIVSPIEFECGFQYSIIKMFLSLNHNAVGGWGGALGDVAYASLHIQLVFAPGIDQSFI